MFFKLIISAAFICSYVTAVAIELTPNNFDDLVLHSGKNTFIKFLAPWWGHCKRMAPAWNHLAAEYKDSASVLIADVDCTASGKDLCQRYGVSGYPTIKYFTSEHPSGEPYNGGRDLETLKDFVQENLEQGCDLNNPSTTCDEKEHQYWTKMKGGTESQREKQLSRLEGMILKPMKPHLKVWVVKRVNILKQMETNKEEL